MVQVRFTTALKRFFPTLQPVSLAGATVADVIQGLEAHYPGIGDYIVDEQGALRQHVNIYIGDHLMEDRDALSDPVQSGDEVLVFQALSGG